MLSILVSAAILSIGLVIGMRWFGGGVVRAADAAQINEAVQLAAMYADVIRARSEKIVDSAGSTQAAAAQIGVFLENLKTQQASLSNTYQVNIHQPLASTTYALSLNAQPDVASSTETVTITLSWAPATGSATRQVVSTALIPLVKVNPSLPGATDLVASAWSDIPENQMGLFDPNAAPIQATSSDSIATSAAPTPLTATSDPPPDDPAILAQVQASLQGVVGGILGLLGL